LSTSDHSFKHLTMHLGKQVSLIIHISLLAGGSPIIRIVIHPGVIS